MTPRHRYRNLGLIAALTVLVALAAIGLRGPHQVARTTQWPAVGRITYGGFFSAQICTGTLVAPDYVLTAAHCVAGKTGQPLPAAAINFAAGWQKGRYVAHSRAAELIFPGGKPDPRSGRASDIALIRLTDPIPVGRITPLPIGDLYDGIRGLTPLTRVAYRADRPETPEIAPDCTPIRERAGVLSLTCPAVSGNSGAPVLSRIDGVWHLLAVMSARTDNAGLARSFAVVPDPRFRQRIPAP